jgi:hypothetical protein
MVLNEKIEKKKSLVSMVHVSFSYTSEGNPWLRHSSHPWHLARPPAVTGLACFFKEQEAGGS